MSDVDRIRLAEKDTDKIKVLEEFEGIKSRAVE